LVSAPASVARRPDLSALTLTIGAGAYALLCVPAIAQRGYPPIDPVWLAVTYLWIAPIWLSAWFDSWAFRPRRSQLMAFAFATGYFDSGTYVVVVPYSADPLAMLLGMVFFSGPIHVVAGFAAEALIQLILRPWRKLHEPAAEERAAAFPKLPLSAWLVGFLTVCAAITFVVAYRELAIRQARGRGVAAANHAWDRGEAVIFRDEDHYKDDHAVFHGVYVTYHVDPNTGIVVRYHAPDNGFQEAYNARIAELIELHGLPSWSLKQKIPSPEALAAMFDASDFTEVVSFPHRLTADITIARRGGTPSASGGSLGIDTPHIGMTGVGGDATPVCVKRQDDLAIVRVGSKTVEVFHRDGRPIVSARR
jgi:hypothetical protein